MIMEINPRRQDGTLKYFKLDGEGYLWMPFDNPSKPREPERLGKLLLAAQVELPTRPLQELCTGKEVVIIPVT